MSLSTPLARVRGLGSAKDGTHHWWVQRLSAIALVPLVIWFVVSLLAQPSFGYAAMRAYVAAPLNAVLLTALVISMFWHARLGLQVVVEDYVHARGLELVLQVLIQFLCFLGALASVFAIARIAFEG